MKSSENLKVFLEDVCYERFELVKMTYMHVYVCRSLYVRAKEKGGVCLKGSTLPGTYVNVVYLPHAK